MSPPPGRTTAASSLSEHSAPSQTERRNIRIATVLKPLALSEVDLCAMDTVRWLRISEGLAAAGFRVDMIVAPGAQLRSTHPNLRLLPVLEVDWGSYDVVKTLYPTGFQALVRTGGGS